MHKSRFIIASEEDERFRQNTLVEERRRQTVSAWLQPLLLYKVPSSSVRPDWLIMDAIKTVPDT